MLVKTKMQLDYRGFELSLGASGTRKYDREYLSLIYGLVMDEKYLGYSVCHICITIDADTGTNFYTRLFKKVFSGCVYVLKRENSAGSFNDNELGVGDSKGEHMHLFVLFPSGTSISIESFTKRLKDLIVKVNRNKYKPRRLRNFNVVNSKVRSWVDPSYLEKYDVWFNSLEERRESTKLKRNIVLKPDNLGKVLRWMSYLAKKETVTSKTQKALFVRDLTTS